MSKEETEVTKEAPKGADAFAAARAQVGAPSGDQDADTATGDDTSTTQPAQDAAKVADESKAATETEDALLTPEEVGKLKGKELDLYKKAQADYTRKTQRLAAREKEIDEWKPLIDGLKTNPKEAVEKIAAQLGLRITETAKQDTAAVDAKTAEAMAELPEEWQFLKPVFEKFGAKLMSSMEGKLQPIAEAHESMVTEAAAAETESTLKAFTASHPGWEKHQTAMLELGQKFVPAKGAMTDLEYMEHLYALATRNDTEAEKTKKVVEKLNRSAKASEEKTSGIPVERVAMKIPDNFAGMDNRERFRAAYEAAKRGEMWEK